MLRRLSALFRRYAATHLDVSGPGHALTDDAGRKIGSIDLVRIEGNRITVSGWAIGARVTLKAGPARASAVPRLPRHDVGDMLGIGPELGFELVMPRPVLQPGQAVTLSVVPRGIAGTPEPLVHVVPMPGSLAARARLALPFAGALLRAAPAMARWQMTGDPRHRTTIKQALGLGMRLSAGLLEARLLAPALPDADGEEGEGPSAAQPVTIILPVYNAFDLLAEVLERVRIHTDLPWHLVMIEDCSSDARVRPFLQDWAAAEGDCVTLILNETNKGFIGSVNLGLAAAVARGHHVVLLNSDAFVPAGWASRLLAPILADDGVASVTPMSNDAEIFSVPVLCRQTVLEPGMADRIDRVAQGFNRGAGPATVPTGVGFCMAMNLGWLRRLPMLDTVFGRGYGEEVDWCQRARAAGGRHLGQPALFVEHRGGTSFGSEDKRRLVAANNAIVARRYPAYDGEVQTFIQTDPLLTARLALGIGWAAAWAEGQEGRTVPVYLAHVMGGGADKYLDRRMAQDLGGGRPSVVIRVGGPTRWRIEVVAPAGVTAGLTDDDTTLMRLMAPLARREIIYSCGFGDSDPVTLPATLLALAGRRADGTAAGDGTPAAVEVLFHDFFPLSPAYTLLDADGIYRGPLTPGSMAARPPKSHQMRRPDGRVVALADWRAAWEPLLGVARLVVFSEDSRTQILAASPGLADRILLRRHALLSEVPRVARPAGPRRVIGVLGNIGMQKGAGLVCELGTRLAKSGALAGAGPGLVLIGNIDPNYALPREVPLHGDYIVGDIPDLVARYGVTDWLIPSIWPETFSYTTHEALATGLPVMAFDIGAQGEAVRGAPNGIALPFGPGVDPVQAVIDAVAGVTG